MDPSTSWNYSGDTKRLYVNAEIFDDVTNTWDFAYFNDASSRLERLELPVYRPQDFPRDGFQTYSQWIDYIHEKYAMTGEPITVSYGPVLDYIMNGWVIGIETPRCFPKDASVIIKQAASYHRGTFYYLNELLDPRPSRCKIYKFKPLAELLSTQTDDFAAKVRACTYSGDYIFAANQMVYSSANFYFGLLFQEIRDLAENIPSHLHHNVRFIFHHDI